MFCLFLKFNLDSGRKQWDDNPHRKTTTTSTTTTTTTTTTTRRPYYDPDRRHYPHRHNTEPTTHRPKHYPHNKPYNPNHNYNYNRVFTERPDTERPYKPYPRYPPKAPHPTDYPRYYPDRPRPHTTSTTTTTTQRPFRHHPHADKPETCNTSYDAITIIRGELFIFKDRVSRKIDTNVCIDLTTNSFYSIFGESVVKDCMLGIHMKWIDYGLVYREISPTSMLCMRTRRDKLYFSLVRLLKLQETERIMKFQK